MGGLALLGRRLADAVPASDVAAPVAVVAWPAAEVTWPAAVAAGPALAPAQAGDWGFVLDNVGYLAGGVGLTVGLTLVSVVLGFVVGFPAGAVELYGPGWARGAVRAVGVFLRGTPLLVILMFTFFVAPVGSAFLAAILGLGLRSAAYQSQIFRGALASVGGGQLEAARSIGLSRPAAIYRVVVPQALRRSIPSFQNEFTIVLKDTSMAFVIGLAELLTRSFNLFVQQTTAVLEVFLFASAVYFVLTVATNRALDLAGEVYDIPGSEER